MIFPSTPFEAYRTDLTRIPTQEGFGPTDSAWLMIATVVRRLSQMDINERADYAYNFAQEAEGARYFCDGADDESLTLMKRVCEPFLTLGDEGGIDRTVSALRDVADDMDARGALSLALSFSSAIHEAFPDAGPREQGLVLIRRGRASRQLGDFEAATELYQMAMDFGNRWEVPELKVRAQLGLAVVDHGKGNYPLARKGYERALADATAHDITDMIAAANHGLMAVADAAGDIDAALRYGWAAFTDHGSSDERRIDMLINLAEVCERAGYHEAALRGGREALSRPGPVRNRLAALGVSARAAARVHDESALAQLFAQGERELKSCTLPFERARLFKNLAAAHFISGDFVAGERCRKEATKLAKRHGFNEIVLQAEELPRQLVRLTRDSQPLTESAIEVVDSLQRMGEAV